MKRKNAILSVIPLTAADAAADTPAPSRILVFNEGWNHAIKGGEHIKFWCDRDVFESLSAQTAERGIDLVFDYEHQSEGPPYTIKNGEVKAAGWIPFSGGFEYEDGVGMFANVKWTPAADEMIRNREYRYFSPALGIDPKSGRITSISSFALTNQPATINQKAIAATVHGVLKMTPQILESLGLDANADEAAVLAAIAALKDAAAKAAEMKDGGDGPDPETKAAMAKQAAELTALKADNAAMNARWQERDLADFLAEGRRAGKITANNERVFAACFKADGPVEARKALAAAEVVVQLGGRVSAAGNGGAGSDDPKKELAEAINLKLKSGLSRAAAHSAVMRENPDLRQRLVASANPQSAGV